MGRSHFNLSLGTFFFHIKLSCPLKTNKKPSVIIGGRNLLALCAHRKIILLSVVLVKKVICWLTSYFTLHDSGFTLKPFKAGR